MPVALTAAILAILATSARAQNNVDPVPPVELASGIAALVGNEVITNAELDEQTLHRREELALRFPPGLVDQEWRRLRRDELERMIEDKLVFQLVAREEAKSKVPYIPEEAIDQEMEQRVNDLRTKGLVLQDADDLYAFYRKTYGMRREAVRKRLRERMAISKFFWQEVFPGIPSLVKPKEARYYYREHLDKFTTPVEMSFRMIVISRGRVDAPEAVLKVEQGIREGVDFSTLAAHYSNEAVEDGNRQRAREKVWRNKSFAELQQWTSPIADVLRTMKPGQISDRVETPQYLHYFKIEEVVTGSPQSFRDVQQAIESEILKGRREQARFEFINELRAKTRVEILLPELRDVPLAEDGAPRAGEARPGANDTASGRSDEDRE